MEIIEFKDGQKLKLWAGVWPSIAEWLPLQKGYLFVIPGHGMGDFCGILLWPAVSDKSRIYLEFLLLGSFAMVGVDEYGIRWLKNILEIP